MPAAMPEELQNSLNKQVPTLQCVVLYLEMGVK